MRKGQLFSVDLLLSLVIIIASIGLVLQASDAFEQQQVSSLENAKMKQIAIDAAAIKFYNDFDGVAGDYEGLNSSAGLLGYSLTTSPSGSACIGSTRGNSTEVVEVFVCRGE